MNYINKTIINDAYLKLDFTRLLISAESYREALPLHIKWNFRRWPCTPTVSGFESVTVQRTYVIFVLLMYYYIAWK
jgi:hypothetical protein